jgi:hypothetical protein
MCTTTDSDTQQTFQLGRVRGTSLWKTVLALKAALHHDPAIRKYLHPQHRTTKQLKADIKVLLAGDDSLKHEALVKKAVPNWEHHCLGTMTPESAASHIIKALDEKESLRILERDLFAILFRFLPQTTTPNTIQQCANGTQAEHEIGKRITRDGILLSHPKTQVPELARLSDITYGACIIGDIIPQLSGRPDVTATACFADGTKSPIAIEIKYLQSPVECWQRLPTIQRYQVQTYAALYGKNRQLYLLQGRAKTCVPGSSHGADCELMPLLSVAYEDVKPNIVWFSWYCKLAREILSQLKPTLFIPGSVVPTSASHSSAKTRQSSSKRTAKGCNAHPPTFRWHVHKRDIIGESAISPNPPKDSIRWCNLGTGWYLYGTYDFRHEGHKATSSNANATKYTVKELKAVHEAKVKTGTSTRQVMLDKGVSSAKARNMQKRVSS